MEDYPVDPVGDTGPAFTPINEGVNMVKQEESTITEPPLAEIKVEGQGEADDDEQDELMQPPSPVTPKKRGRKNQKANVDDTPTKKTKVSPAKANPIPTSLEAAGPEDSMLFRMKEVEGRAWGEVSAAIEAMTGTKSNIGSLKSRFNRMKANFVVFEPDHVPIFLQKKKEAEEKFEAEKWQKIGEALESECGKKYPPATLQKKFKEVTKKNNAAAVVVKDDE